MLIYQRVNPDPDSKMDSQQCLADSSARYNQLKIYAVCSCLPNTSESWTMRYINGIYMASDIVSPGKKGTSGTTQKTSRS
jgi:hypothetical protein